MVTHVDVSVVKPVTWLNLSATHSVISPLSTNYWSVLIDPNWHAAMSDEYKAFMDNGTWSLVPRPPGRANVVSDKWIFKHKFHSDCSLARHKVQWVVRRFS